METTVICNDLSELISVAKFWGIDVKTQAMLISFPYHFKIDHEILVGTNEVLTFADFKEKYL